MNPNPNFSNVQVDWNTATTQLADLLRGQLNNVLAGTADDLNSFALGIASDMTRALAQGKTEMSAELRGQAKALLEINRIRVSNTTNALLDVVLGTTMRVASIALGNVTGWMASRPV